MQINSDREMSRLCDRLMSIAQNALDSVNFVVDEMDRIAQENPEREDIKACVDEIKRKNKSGESSAWVVANHWSDHFSGIGESDAQKADEKGGETDGGEDNQPDGEQDSGETDVTEK